MLADSLGSSWELQLEIDLNDADLLATGLIISHGEDLQTALIFDRRTSDLIVDRSRSHHNYIPDVAFNNEPDIGPLPILRIHPADPPVPRLETLQLRIFFDNSVMEVFANERVAISSRIYCGSNRAHQIRAFSEGGAARFSNVQAWSGLSPAFPSA